ncbi:hypothetical protein [Sulfurisphaera ohwakuensis]|uniref:Tetratricopeptide (TPR) repeat protein n=1 Tax=Sulfurisphaera ohwakuensis TaxID=69656 RepID=A0A650CF84_SULOH|nr:hypothetical protein [Sulfurisphaera ohwakuensis]MBB5254132.1 tetratricopeptide (TPR) repeat protein [Sulfurisphaera ohwakuensis]QGR16513.1 hypothetical protein D1869_04345 [Sulfurisphaera ohwakuensis]
MTTGSGANHESHVQKLLASAGMIDYYKEFVNIISDSSINSGNYAYYFNISNIIGAKNIKRVFLGKYSYYLRNSVQFIPIYSPALDRIVTLKYWGKYKDFFQNYTDIIIQFDSILTCYPSSICEYQNPATYLDDPNVRKALGLYWTFSISPPYNERNPLLGNTYVIVGNDSLHIFKIYHTYVKNSKNGVEYLDINFGLKAAKNMIDDNYMTYFIIKDLEIEKNNKKESIEFIPYLTKNHFNDTDIMTRFAFLILRSMYLRKSINELDFLNLGNLDEFKQLFTEFIKKVELAMYSSNFKIKINIDNLTHLLFEDENLEFRNNGNLIPMFIIDNMGDIIFVHPLITISFLTNKKKKETYEKIINIFKDSITRKEFLKALKEKRNILSLSSEMEKKLKCKLDYVDVVNIKKMFESIYTSVLLNKNNVK